MGPNLSQIGANAASRVTGLSGPEYLAQSILDPGAFVAPDSGGQMPAGLADGVDDAALRGLIAYLLEHGGVVDKAALLQLPLTRPPLTERFLIDKRTHVGLIRRGEKLFTETLACGACHGLYGDAGATLLAPSLGQAALLDTDYMLESIENPSAVIVPGYAQAQVELRSGDSIFGRVWMRTADSIKLLVTGPQGLWQLRNIDMQELAQTDGQHAIFLNPISLMPPYKLSAVQRIELLAFLRTLKAEAGLH